MGLGLRAPSVRDLQVYKGARTMNSATVFKCGALGVLRMCLGCGSCTPWAQDHGEALGFKL